jgi:phosphoribosyl 1,2-cyclic phosphodiesterase
MGLVKNNGTPTFLSDRIIQSHMNLDTCKKLLMANNLTQVNNIVLIHLSDRNSDAKYFKQTITELTGKNVSVAEPGLVIDFNKTAI